MWSEATNSLTLVSKGAGGAGNSDACSASFTTGCGVVTYSNISFCALLSGHGGNCRSDNSIASQSGDIYFFSPEQLDGSRGIPNKENLYVFHDGGVQYVTTFTTGPFCVKKQRRLHRRSLQRHPDCQDAGLPRRQPHGLSHRQPGHPVRQRRPPRDVPLRSLHPGGRVRVLLAQWGAAELRRAGEPERPLHGQRRSRLLLYRRRPGPGRHQRRVRRVRVRQRPSAADYSGDG